MCKRRHTRTHIHIHLHIHPRVHIFIHDNSQIHMRTCRHTRIHTHIHLHIHTRIHIFICVVIYDNSRGLDQKMMYMYSKMIMKTIMIAFISRLLSYMNICTRTCICKCIRVYTYSYVTTAYTFKWSWSLSYQGCCHIWKYMYACMNMLVYTYMYTCMTTSWIWNRTFIWYWALRCIHESMLQCVVPVLQYVAVRCSAMPCGAVCCGVLQCGVFDYLNAYHSPANHHAQLIVAVWLQCVAVCCSVLQCGVLSSLSAHHPPATDRIRMRFETCRWECESVWCNVV